MPIERVFRALVTVPDNWNDPQDELPDEDAWDVITVEVKDHISRLQMSGFPSPIIQFIEWEEEEE